MKPLTIATLAIVAIVGAHAQAQTQQPQVPQQQQPGMAPKHERSGTEDMTRAVPPMTPDAKPSGNAQGAGGWTADGKLRQTGKADAVEDKGSSATGAGSGQQGNNSGSGSSSGSGAASGTGSSGSTSGSGSSQGK